MPRRDLPCLRTGCFSSARYVARDNRAILAHVCRFCFEELAIEEQKLYAEIDPESEKADRPKASEMASIAGAGDERVYPRVSHDGAHLYLVAYGDSPWKIAVKFTGDGRRWRELVRANPKKPKTDDGLTFRELKIGEYIRVPADWCERMGP
jgi:nucleoid-associated protein YgaU